MRNYLESRANSPIRNDTAELTRLARRMHSPLIPIIAILVGLVFVADLMTPLSIVSWVLYLAPLGICLYAGRPMAPLAVAGAATLEMTIGLLMSPPSTAAFDLARINRGIGLLSVWITAFFVRRSVLSQLALQREDWLQTGRTRLVERVQGELTVHEIGERALSFLAEYLDVHVGALYKT